MRARRSIPGHSLRDAATWALAVGLTAIGALLFVLALAGAVAALSPLAAAAATAAVAPVRPDSSAVPLPPVQAVRLTQPIKLDGILDEPVWQEASPVTQFFQYEPVEGALPSQRTEVRVAYDDEALYIGARMYDTAPDSIRAELARKDVTTGSDRLVVFIDAFHDRRTGFYFGVNVAGTFYDGTLFNNDWDSDAWDGIWDARTHRDAQGWTAEMKIPFSQLRFHNDHHSCWGINFERIIPRHNERDYVAIRSHSSSGFVSKFPDLMGIDELDPPRRLAVSPYLTGRADYLGHSPADPFHDGSRYGSKIGGDLKLGLGAGLTLDGTVNPDFGQVEVDPAVVNLGDVETFYPEKRPFFLEGDNIFRFGNNGASNYNNFNWSEPLFFYTRRIGRAPQGTLPSYDYADVPSGTTILGAAKITGQLPSGWTLGTVQAVTDREDARLALGSQRFSTEVEPLTYYGVGRASKRRNDGLQGVGFMSTLAARSFDGGGLQDQFNRAAGMAGVDGWTFLNSSKVWVISGYATATRIEGSRARILALEQSPAHYLQRPDVQKRNGGYLNLDSTATSLDGAAVRLWLNKEKGASYCNAALGFQSPGFDISDLGYFGYGDVINGHISGGYNWNTPGKVRQYTDIGGGIFRSMDFGGQKLVDGIAGWHDFNFLNGRGYSVFLAYNPPHISDRATRGGPRTYQPDGGESNFSLHTDQNRPLIYRLNGWGARYGSSNSRDWGLNPEVEWHPSSGLTFTFSPSFERSQAGSQWVAEFDDPAATATYGHYYVFAPLNQTTLNAGVRLNWTFTPRASLQLYTQPYITSGDYGTPKFLAQARSDDYVTFGQRGSTYDPATGIGDPDGAGPAAAISIPNDNFNYKSLRGSAVLRWEYLPGSTMYLVWTQTRSQTDPIGDFQFNHSFNQLINLKGDNILLLKLSYWWGG